TIHYRQQSAGIPSIYGLSAGRKPFPESFTRFLPPLGKRACCNVLRDRLLHQLWTPQTRITNAFLRLAGLLFRRSFAGLNSLACRTPGEAGSVHSGPLFPRPFSS